MTARPLTALSRSIALVALLAAGACALPLRSSAPAAAGLDAELDAIFADTSLAQAHWGVLVRSEASGESLYELNADRLFVPASNMKLVTGAAALAVLGPDYRFRTEIAAAGPVRDGVLQGPLVVRGSGDPTISTRFAEDVRDVFRAWADSLRAHGITRVAGGIIGVDSAFPGPPLGSGWAWDDAESAYAAEISALQLEESAIDLQIFPSGTVGAPPVVVLDPPTQFVGVANRAITAGPGGETRLSISREAIGPGLRIEGEIAQDTTLVERRVAVRGATGYFLSVLRETLREAGVAIDGRAMDADELPADEPSAARAQPVFVWSSPPLWEILPAMMKPSQNQIAETLLRAVGSEARGDGTARGGAAVIDSLFVVWGLDPDEIRAADGSGLSRYDLVSPNVLVALLVRMRSTPESDLWYESLPIGGIDGTLENRMREPPLRGNVHAKTGSLSGVRSLSGYLTTAGGERIVFSILVNNHNRNASAVDRIADQALERIARIR